MKDRTAIILGVVVVALLIVAGVAVIKGTGVQVPATSGEQATEQTQTQPFGPPTKLPRGTKPAAYVKQYYQAILDGDYEKAYVMQPASSKAQGDAESFAAQQKRYGMKSFSLGAARGEGDTVEVECRQDLGPNGRWVTLWTFQKLGKDWIVTSKRTGMASQ